MTVAAAAVMRASHRAARVTAAPAAALTSLPRKIRESIHLYIKLEVITRMVPKVGKERQQRGGVGYLVVACEFRQKQVVHPIVLQIGDISPQVLFHHCVHPFGLSICLRMKSGREAWILRQEQRCLQKRDTNWGPLSDTIVSGSPW